VNWTLPAFSCETPSTGIFQDDPGTCANSGRNFGINWNDQHPEILVIAGSGDSFQVGYGANLNFDPVINMTNDGAYGNICVNAYAFDPNEELLSCCSCAVTPNALESLSIASLLDGATLTGQHPTSGVVELIASTTPGGTPPGSASDCNASASFTLVPGLRAWNTNFHLLPTATPAVTETPFSISNLSPAELTHLTSFCSFIQGFGGSGICTGCTSGGQ
jgi:hypothetical protein